MVAKPLADIISTMITLGKTIFELQKVSSGDFIQRVNEYLLKAPSNSSPGNPKFAHGEVDTPNECFVISPFFTGRQCLFPVSSFGTIKNDQNQSHIEIEFRSNLWGTLILICFFIFGAITFWNVEGAQLLFIFFGIPILISVIFERRHYLRSIKRHLEFLKQFDS